MLNDGQGFCGRKSLTRIPLGIRVQGALILLLLLGVPCVAQPLSRQTLAPLLDFEKGLEGWRRSPDSAADDAVFHGGKQAARIVRTAESNGAFSSVSVEIPVDFTGSKIEWRGYLKTKDVQNAVALWMRVDGDSPGLAFATLQGQKIDGTRDWKEYSIEVNSPAEGRALHIGFLLVGPGALWVDDLQLLVDGKPASMAAARPVVETPLTKDREFDGGSGFKPTALSATQVSNLTTLGRIWGFLKYHHPAITAGEKHWDYELLRVLPAVVGAADREKANAAILAWVQAVGPVAACRLCASVTSERLHLAPELDWLDDKQMLGTELSSVLRSIHRNRRIVTRQFYVSSFPGVGNPRFENEPVYPKAVLPDAGFQLLALFRAWNAVHYFYPARDTMPDNKRDAGSYWPRTLEEFVPRVALADSPTAYKLEMLRFIAKINDTHANLWSALDARPPVGACRVPASLRFIEGKPVVYRLVSTATKLSPGDVVVRYGGVPVEELVEKWKPFYAASNEPTRLRDIGRAFLRGDCGPVKVDIVRGDTAMTLEETRVPIAMQEFAIKTNTHDRPGPVFQKLSDDVAYLKMTGVKAADAPKYVRDAEGTKGLIIDIRNYPTEFMVFALGSLLHGTKTPFVRFTSADLTNPGATYWGPPLEIEPAEPHYKGKVVILVDDSSISQSEYTAMAFRAVPGAKVIGSMTAGADGNVSAIPLPGGLQTMISGLGVFYPNQGPTQRIGIQPDIVVTPTIKGIREGRDEVVEAAIREITGAGK